MRTACLALTLLAASALAQSPATPTNPPGVAATVNGEAIPLAKVDAVVKTWPTAGAPLRREQLRQVRADVLDALIDDTLYRQYLAKHGPKLDPAKVDRAYAGLVENARRAGKSPAEFFREVGGEAEGRAAITVALQAQELAEAGATPEALKKLYADNKDHFDGVTVRVRHVMLRVAPGAPPGERAAAHAKLLQLRAELAAGKLTFAEAARKHSIDATAAAGGDAGFVGRRDPNFDDEFCRAAFALPVNGLSDPTDTSRAVYLILVTERKAGTPSTYEQAAERVIELHYAQHHAALLARLRQAATIAVTLP